MVGYVQSGKTLSFTTVIGLARDNGFPLVIVIAGTKSPLLIQSTERLDQDLNISASGGSWRKLTNPRDENKQTITTIIGDWRDPELDADERATLVITVLKQKDHLEHLTKLLRSIDLQGIPVLVVDDEADQAGLNTKVRTGESSTTYSWLLALRSSLPSHTYLQYTATPQAPLLINIMGALSPSFVHVLEPGEGYVGGQVFFGSGSKYVEAIPAADVFPANSLPANPPDSLIKAMRVFFVGLAYSILVRKEGEAVRRSMLIHPSPRQSDHQQIHSWASRIVDEWRRTLSLKETDPDRIDMLADFRKAYEDLKRTEKSLPPFEQIMEKLPRSLRRTQVIEFNTNGRPKTPEIDWQDANGWILIGGQAVDRGFTVDSLTVTYMGRSIGTGNADSVQQRARFFGYKKKYIGICRVYLEPGALNAFTNYVNHEEIMRAELQGVATSGEPLREWKRRFALSPALRLCRTSVIAIGDDLIRGKRNGGWTQQRDALLTTDIRRDNARLLDALENKCSFVEDTSFASTLMSQRHLVAHGIPLLDIIEILVDYRLLDGRDVASLTGTLLQLGHIVRSNPGATASVYKMRPDIISRRTVDESGQLPDGFQQGRTGDGIGRYPGDTFFASKDEVSLQIHRFSLDDKGKVQRAEGAPMIAINIPSKLAIDWLVQNQASQP